MLTKSTRWKPGLALAVMTAVLGLSDLAVAQQSGLLPLQPIRRERVPCDQEDPVYKLYRYQYFGYHPTVWRRFPDGWGVPSPEASNPTLEFQKLPLKPPQIEEPDQGDDDGQNQDMQAPPGGARPAVPNPPAEGERSPFEMDRPAPNAGGPGAGPGGAAPRRPAPRTTPPPAANEPSPFEILKPPAELPRRTAPALPRTNAPDLAPPAESPKPQQPRTSRNDRDVEPADDADRQPMLALNDPLALPPAEEAPGPPEVNRASVPEPTVSGSPAVPSPGAPEGATLQAAPRRTRLGALFGGMGWNWRRR